MRRPPGRGAHDCSRVPIPPNDSIHSAQIARVVAGAELPGSACGPCHCCCSFRAVLGPDACGEGTVEGSFGWSSLLLSPEVTLLSMVRTRRFAAPVGGSQAGDRFLGGGVTWHERASSPLWGRGKVLAVGTGLRSGVDTRARKRRTV